MAAHPGDCTLEQKFTNDDQDQVMRYLMTPLLYCSLNKSSDALSQKLEALFYERLSETKGRSVLDAKSDLGDALSPFR